MGYCVNLEDNAKSSSHDGELTCEVSERSQDSVRAIYRIFVLVEQCG